MRLDRPADLYAFCFSYLTGLAYSACGAPETPEPASLLKLFAIFLPFSIVLLGAVCTWKDTTDQHINRHVARTRHRPLTRGAVCATEANVFALAQLSPSPSSTDLRILPQPQLDTPPPP
ncbi:uncharacterized protein F4807DRAFT_417212 [Annulohypoxylon truncatum]|uniref:uncharacterized protein n=1 Tax=Annulohypoxylon truncatum TaxID=327061 RepID=UPI0020076120|nr:uncharacterized protein F4807DRAFT_417212 [Annulohypoxylon truncatum]KAI1211998.1 hypothetical protein F4807DRAFT_417212 [Annulohypoxylon truncatum]